MDISCRGTLDLFNCTKKYRRFDAFLITSLICSFHVRLLDMVRPGSFALVTLSSSLPSTTIGANWGSSFTNYVLSSLHFSLLSLTLFCIDRSATLWELRDSGENSKFLISIKIWKENVQKFRSPLKKSKKTFRNSDPHKEVQKTFRNSDLQKEVQKTFRNSDPQKEVQKTLRNYDPYKEGQKTLRNSDPP